MSNLIQNQSKENLKGAMKMFQSKKSLIHRLVKILKNVVYTLIQNKKNLPLAIANSKRFLAVKKDKTAAQTAWSNPDNQKYFDEVRKTNHLAGFDTVGHGVDVDYLFLDFDHVLNPETGEFTNEKAAEIFNELRDKFPQIYVERSISGTGLHIFMIPTAGKFESVSNGSNGVLYFDNTAGKNRPKLEIFYGGKGRYCIVTGNLFGDGKDIPAGKLVDDYFQSLLDRIQAQKNSKSARVPKLKDGNNLPVVIEHKDGNNLPAVIEYNDPPEYKNDFMLALIDYIEPTANFDADWLSVASSCKNLGIPYWIFDNWCRRDPSRYNAVENKKRWDSLENPNFNIGNLIGKAQNNGFNVKEFKRQWYFEHHEYSDYNRRNNLTLNDLEAELKDVNNQIASLNSEGTAAMERLNSVENFTRETLMSPEVLNAAAFCKLYNPTIFEAFKNKVQNLSPRGDNGVKLSDFLRSVSDSAKKIDSRRTSLAKEKKELEADIKTRSFTDNDPELKGFKRPEGYYINSVNGVKKLESKGFVDVCRRPISIKKIIFDVENKTYKLALQYQNTKGEWNVIPATGAEIIANKTKIVDLAANGFPVDSGNALNIVNFLSAFRVANENTIPLEHSVPRGGWHSFYDNVCFVDPRIPSSSCNIPIVIDSYSQFANALKAVGTLAAWREAFLEIKKYPVARFIVAASIAPPLLKVLGERNLMIHICAPTRAGKTTALLLGASTFGSEKVIRSFDATKNGLIGAAADVNDYAFLIDEKQVADSYLKLDNLVYGLANGIGRTKLNKDSSIRKLDDWRTIVISTGETVLTDDNVTGGVFTRLLQVDAGKEVLPPDVCKKVRTIIKNNYGVVFKSFIRCILAFPYLFCPQLSHFEAPSIVIIFESLVSDFEEKYPEFLPEHRRYMALITLADIFLNIIVDGEIFADADDDDDLDPVKITDLFFEYTQEKKGGRNILQEMADKIFPLIPSKTEIDDSPREMDCIKDFIGTNQNSFVGTNGTDISTMKNIYGKFSSDFVYIAATAVKKACDDARFNYKKLVNDLIANGFFIPADIIEKGRHAPLNNVKVRIGASNLRCYRIPSNLINNEETNFFDDGAVEETDHFEVFDDENYPDDGQN